MSPRLGYSVNNAYPSDGATPMDLSYAENDKAELQAAEQSIGVQMFHLSQYLPSTSLVSCSSASSYSATPTLREQNHWVTAGKRQYPVGAGRPAGDELSSVEPVGGTVQQGTAPKRAEFLTQNVNASEACWSSRRRLKSLRIRGSF